jgi:hypothetical protein
LTFTGEREYRAIQSRRKIEIETEVEIERREGTKELLQELDTGNGLLQRLATPPLLEEGKKTSPELIDGRLLFSANVRLAIRRKTSHESFPPAQGIP